MHRSKFETITDFLIGKDKKKPELSYEQKMLMVTCRMAKKQANVFLLFWLSFWMFGFPGMIRLLTFTFG